MFTAAGALSDAPVLANVLQCIHATRCQFAAFDVRHHWQLVANINKHSDAHALLHHIENQQSIFVNWVIVIALLC